MNKTPKHFPDNCYPEYWLDKINKSKFVPKMPYTQAVNWANRLALWHIRRIKWDK